MGEEFAAGVGRSRVGFGPFQTVVGRFGMMVDRFEAVVIHVRAVAGRFGMLFLRFEGLFPRLRVLWASFSAAVLFPSISPTTMSDIPLVGRRALLLVTLLVPALAQAQAPPLTLTSPSPETSGQFGSSVSGVADTDGDRLSDLLIGANGEDVGTLSAGQAYLFSGVTGALIHALQSSNPEGGGSFGVTVWGVADADGDGRGDLLVGAYLENGGATDAGRAYLFSGASGALLRTLESPNPEGLFGTSVSGVPDTDGDGRGDLLVGAEEEDGGANVAGRAYLFSGATGALLHTLISPMPVGGGRLGQSVSGVPDADDDGRGDLLIGAFGEGASFAGRVYLFSGATGALLRTLTSPNPEPSGNFGFSVSGVLEADGDGRGDFLVSTRYESGGADEAGRVYLFPSGSGIVVTASDTPTTISPGGTVSVTALVTNNLLGPVTGDLWVVAERNGASLLTRLIGSGTVAAGATLPVSFSLRAPGSTPPGTYTINVNVGSFPNAVVASDAFDVTVTGSALAGAPSAEPFVVEAVAGDVFTGGEVAPSSATSSSAVVVGPNPFAGRTALRFSLAEAGAARLSVHDALGREVAVLLDGAFEAGAHAAVFDARGLASGIYVWRLAAGGRVQTGRLTLLD